MPLCKMCLLYPRETSNNFPYLSKVTAFDADVGSNGKVTYSISNGNIDAAFAIDAIGNITISRKLDRENVAAYQLLITAQDSKLRFWISINVHRLRSW